MILELKKEYTVKKELEPEPTHTVQVIAKYKDGTTIRNATLPPKLQQGYLELKIGTIKRVRGGYVLTYDVAKYKKVKVDVETTSSDCPLGVQIGIMDKNEDCFTSKKPEFDIKDIIGAEETSKAREVYQVNVEKVQDICQIEIIKRITSNESTVVMHIYNLWLEK